MAKKSGSMAKNLVMIVFVVGAGAFVWMQMQKRELIKQESKAVDTLNEGKYEDAIKRFEKLLGPATGEAAKRHKANLAKCYVNLAEADGLVPTKMMELYGKAAEYDETALPENIRTLLASRPSKKAGPTTGSGNTTEEK